ncbi:M1 family metallopeptidase [Arenimonas oryziterrae]|uniref:Aminopeptidase N n=1 Tax=Arenimonas oryziterrae DSM 21050 = YC6267 TaxID=1121015 RepID=A0A091BEK2_9GAMM|nr:M1 family metallopeptidase [Arenimonas oryziterrae]KFN42825.1 hypothetical protein N789_11890 [Arenimonas oryziterrae DSM 21050 = YC6267]
MNKTLPLMAGLLLVGSASDVHAQAAAATSPVKPEQPVLTERTVYSGAPMTPEQKAVVFEKADLQFTVDPAKKHLDGNAALTFRATAPVARIVVDLDQNLPISRVEVDGQVLAATAYSNPDGQVTVTLPKPLAVGERTTVRLVYAGKPHVAARAPWDGGFVWATAPTGEPWIATAVQGEGCDLFWPCIDHPMGEPEIVDQHITVPAPLVAAGNGVAMGMEEKNGWRTYHWRIKNPDTYSIALNIGPYELLSADYQSRFGNTIPLRFWYLRGNEAKAKVLFTEFPQLLDFFESTIGPYPFADEKMGVVETPHKGMEHQTINAYGNEYVKTSYGYDELLQHEFSHEWFGNQLTNSDWDDMWLHEGFGSYMQPLYMEYLHGDLLYYTQLNSHRIKIRNKFPVVSGQTMREEDVYSGERGPGGDIYAKGSVILHTLRQLIGDEAFFTSVRRLVYGTATPKPGNFKPRYGSTKEFLAIINEVTGKDYTWFFDVYLYQAALPQLLVQRDATGLNLSWKTQGNGPFPMPVDVRVDGRVQTLTMADGRGRVALSAHSVYTLDPHSKVLRQEDYIDVYQRFEAERMKAMAERAAAEAAKKK